MRNSIFIILFFYFVVEGFSQQPFISDFSPKYTVGSGKVSISGSGFSNDSRVFFSSSEASSVMVVSKNLIEVVVPNGATYGPIIVLSNGKIAISKEPFYISFGGQTIDKFDSEFLVKCNETDANNLIIKDLDGDKKNDIVISHNVNQNGSATSKAEITLYRNNLNSTSTLSSGNFKLTESIKNADGQPGAFSMDCADLNNDGKPEIILTSNKGTNTKQIYIYKNLSTVGNFKFESVSEVSISLPKTSSNKNRIPGSVRVSDIDGDGKKDLIVGSLVDDDLNSESSKLFIFKNTSSGASNFKFDSPKAIDVKNAGDTRVLTIADFNGDNKLDIATIPFRKDKESIYILTNKSSETRINFSEAIKIDDASLRVNIKAGDFNNDGKIDLITTSRKFNEVRLYGNISTDSKVEFKKSQTIKIDNSGSWGISIGDINGDKKPDLVIGGAEGTNKNIFILENESNSELKFKNPFLISTTKDNLHLAIGDLNNDGKPDIAFTHNIKRESQSNLGIFINRNCIKPIITPDISDICLNEAVELSTIKSTASDITYKWSILSGNATLSTTNSFKTKLTATSGTPVKVQIEISQNGCSEVAQKTFTIANATGTPSPTIKINDGVDATICENQKLILSTSNTYGKYFWTKPDGTTSNESKIIIEKATAKDAGKYKVSVQNDGNCRSIEVIKNISISILPTLEITNNGKDFICNETNLSSELEVKKVADISYQWKKNGNNISGATTNKLKVTEAGKYSVVLKNAENCSSKTKAYTIKNVGKPITSIKALDEVCLNVSTTIKSNSTVNEGFKVINKFEIFDANNQSIHTSDKEIFEYTFTKTGKFIIKLTSSYDSEVVTGCSESLEKIITVTETPKVTFNVDAGFKKCRSQSLKLEIKNPTPDKITSIEWEVDGKKTKNQSVNIQTTENQNSVVANVSLTLKSGCQITDRITINNFEDTSLKITTKNNERVAKDTTINGKNYKELIILGNKNYVELLASGGAEYTWLPSIDFKVISKDDVIFYPKKPLSTILLNGTDQNNCQEKREITIYLDNVRPRRTFSPNNDGEGYNCWEILNTSELTGCKVYIFDSRGRNILVKDSPYKDNCVWDGTFNGNPVPEGVYYYVLKCSEKNLSKSGSIMLAR